MSRTAIKISVIIPTYNRKDDLKRLLESLAESDINHKEIETIVVDNAGNLEIAELENSAGDIRVVLERPGKNLFCSGGREYGALKATGDYLFFIDDDNILDRKCIRLLVGSFDKIPNLGVAAPLMLVFKEKDRIWSAGVKLNKLGQPLRLQKNESIKNIDMPEFIDDIDCFPNAFMVKRSVFKDAPFDTKNFPHNWSEADFGQRVKRKGYARVINTQAIEWHDIDYQGMITRTDKNKIYDQSKSRILFRKRFMNSGKDWALFTLITFPVSTLYYLKSIVSTPGGDKLAMIKGYIRGTTDGAKASIVHDV